MPPEKPKKQEQEPSRINTPRELERAKKDLVESGATPKAAEIASDVEQETGVQVSPQTAQTAAKNAEQPEGKLDVGRTLKEAFGDIGKLFTELMTLVKSIFGGEYVKNLTDEEVKIEPKQVKKDLEAAKIEPGKISNYGEKLAAIWNTKPPENLKWWFCQIERRNEYLTDTNGLQSFGPLQFNGALLQKFCAYVRNQNANYFSTLSGSTQKKVLSIAERGQRAGDFSNFLTDDEGIEFLEKIFLAHPELAFNFHGEYFFEKQLEPKLAQWKKDFPDMADFINFMSEDRRYLAVFLDLMIQCGAGGGSRVVRYMLEKLQAEGNFRPKPVEAIFLLTQGSNETFGKRRALRTFRTFLLARGTEYGIRHKTVDNLLDAFMAATEQERTAMLENLEKKKVEGTLRV